MPILEFKNGGILELKLKLNSDGWCRRVIFVWKHIFYHRIASLFIYLFYYLKNKNLIQAVIDDDDGYTNENRERYREKLIDISNDLNQYQSIV